MRQNTRQLDVMSLAADTSLNRASTGDAVGAAGGNSVVSLSCTFSSRLYIKMDTAVVSSPEHKFKFGRNTLAIE
jgi:hypothetical protein